MRTLKNLIRKAYFHEKIVRFTSSDSKKLSILEFIENEKHIFSQFSIFLLHFWGKKLSWTIGEKRVVEIYSFIVYAYGHEKDKSPWIYRKNARVQKKLNSFTLRCFWHSCNVTQHTANTKYLGPYHITITVTLAHAVTYKRKHTLVSLLLLCPDLLALHSCFDS